jgi:membrane-associated protease RseP (regulator of RpoE activity)
MMTMFSTPAAHTEYGTQPTFHASDGGHQQALSDVAGARSFGGAIDHEHRDSMIEPSTSDPPIITATTANDTQFRATQLVSNGNIRPGYLGIKVKQVTQDMVAALGLTRSMGMIVSETHAGSPAATAGLQVGDVILRYDNRTLSHPRALTRAIAKSTIGQAVPLTILRDGRAQVLRATPAELPGTVTPTASVSNQAPQPVCWSVTPPWPGQTRPWRWGQQPGTVMQSG